MTSLAIFEKAANREVTAQKAAEMLIEADTKATRAARLRRKPRWMPVLVWALGFGLVAALLSTVGFKTNDG